MCLIFLLMRMAGPPLGAPSEWLAVYTSNPYSRICAVLVFNLQKLSGSSSCVPDQGLKGGHLWRLALIVLSICSMYLQYVWSIDRRALVTCAYEAPLFGLVLVGAFWDNV